MKKRLSIRVEEKIYKLLKKKLIDAGLTFQEFVEFKIKDFLINK